jgi:ABC-type glycerol-3-phosphate transport system substrate-binding protein
MSSHPTPKHPLLYTVFCALIVLSLLLSACAKTATAVSTDAGVTNQPPTASPSPQPSAAPAAESDSDEHPVITFAANEYERSLYEPLIEQFNGEHPEMTVQFAPLPEYTGAEDEATQDYERSQASTGDTLMIWNASYATGRYYRDLQPLIETDPTFQPDDFWPNALAICQDAEGRQLGVPLTFNVNGIFYDKTAFDEAELPYPQPGWTLDDFQKAITGVARQNGDKIRYGLAEQYSSILNVLIEAALDANDGDISAETIQPVVEWYINLVKAKAIYAPPYAEEDQDWNKAWQDWQDLFKSENRPVMWTGGLSEMTPGSDYMMPSSDDPLEGLAIKTEGFVPFPVTADGSYEQTSQVWSQCVAISAGSRNPRAAWKWLNFLSQQRLLQENTYVGERLQLPARISVADSSGYWEGLPAGLEDSIRFAVEHAWPGSSYAATSYQVYTAVTKVTAGKADLVTALDEVKSQMAEGAVPSPTPNTTPIVVATPKPTLSADATQVEYYFSAWGPDHTALQAIVDEYNKTHADSPVVFRGEFNFQSDTYFDYQAAIAQEFDCFTAYTGNANAENPSILPLDTFIESEGPEFVQDFDPALLDSLRQNGTLLGLPAVSQPQIMGYNADLLAKRGIEPPGNDWTFEDFIALAARAASTDEADLSYGFLTSAWETFLLDNRGIQGADTQSDPPVAKFTSPEFANGLAWLSDLLQSGTLLTQTNDNYMDIQSAMQDGKVAFWVTQAGQPTGWYTDAFNPPTYKVGVAPMPTNDTPTSIASNWSNDQAHFISASSQNPQACWDWIKYLSEQPTAFSGIPARKSAQNSPAWAAKVGEQYVEVYQLALSRAKRTTIAEQAARNSPISWPLNTWQQQIIIALFAGEDTAKIIATSQQKAEDYLACMAPVEWEGMESTALQKEIYQCVMQADPDGDWGWMNSGE